MVNLSTKVGDHMEYLNNYSVCKCSHDQIVIYLGRTFFIVNFETQIGGTTFLLGDDVKRTPTLKQGGFPR
jgi:hypothetical protein